MQSNIQPPSIPAGVGAAAGDGQVAVFWSAVSGAASYNVYYRTTAGVTTVNGTKVTGATSGGAITGLANGTTYYFKVSAVNAGGESTLSSSWEVAATPQVAAAGAPTGVSASAGDGQATVSWAAVSGAASYNVYYRTTAGVTTVNGTKVTGATSAGAITGLANGTAYYFRVTAVNAGGESALSSEVLATPQVAAAGAPTGVSATPGDGQVAVNWSAVAGATSYNVYYRTTTGVTTGNGTKVTGAASGGAVTGLTNGQIYYFVVTAVNAGGESAVSSEANATPQIPAPTGVGTVQKVPDTGQTTKYSAAFGDDSDYLINAPSYTDNGNGTITDNVTTLMWQKQDDATPRAWAAAGTYCNDLVLGGHSDWRLPSRMDLITIVNSGTYNPSINATYFPATQSSKYWSSTTFAYGTTGAWYVHFLNGYVSSAYKTYYYYVRCVRLGQ